MRPVDTACEAYRREMHPSGPAPSAGRRRRLFVILGAVAVLAVGGVTAGLLLTGQPGWHLTWHDEFDGRQVDRSHWTVRNDAWAPNEESIDTSRPENVSVAEGHLVLTARRETMTVGSTTRQYTSGYVDTIGHRSFKYGRFEMRAKLPASVGLWPAFWLRTDGGLGEVDVLEAVGGMPERTLQTVHQSTNGDQAKVGNVYDLPTGTTSAWHTYSVEVKRDKLTWTIDGRRVFEVTTKQAPWLTKTFDRPMNLRINLQVGGSLPNYYGYKVGPDTEFPSRYEIDWVRVYQYG